ncbi:MAG TPA: APC family permease [Candidatus Dormibacteraeota bacterium]|nr:APC family permease [Candidatus Dormibacteraeota bacterium]
MATVAEPVIHGQRVESELKTNTLNLFDTTVIATSSVAPAYSLAASVALVFAFVGVTSPAAILVSFIPVLFIAMAYYYLNRMDPNCGASYSWVSRTLNPYIGWFSGWVQLAANVLFCASAPIVAGSYTLQLLNSVFPGQVSSDAASNKYWIAGVGVAWLALVTFMVVRGIRITANFQWILVAIEYLIVLGFALAAIIKVVGGQHATNSITADWFNPGSVSFGALAGGVALGIFFFWGWDTAANVNEESKDANENPGRAGIISMFILLFIFLIAAIAMQLVISQDAFADPNNSTNILYYFAQQLASSPLTYLMILAVVSSTVATLQTTLLPSSRLSFSMARDGVFPKPFGMVHRTWLTPWVGTIITAIFSVVVVVVTLLSDSVSSVFANLILDIGVLVSVYYGVTGIACFWAFRKVLTTSPKLLMFAGVLPLAGGLALLALGGYVTYQSWTTDITTALPVLVAMALGIPLLLLAVITNRSGFFREKTVSYVMVDGTLTAAPTAARI